MITLKDDTELVGARTAHGSEITVYDDYMGPVWVYGQEFGPMCVIRALSWESAYEIAIDESPTIPPEEVPEAYGYYGDDAQARLDADMQAAEDGERDCPDLVEGYTYQSNSSGTGIVATGHHEWLHEYTRDDLRRVVLVVRRYE